MSVPQTGSDTPADALLSAAHHARLTLVERAAVASIDLGRAATFRIEDETRARSTLLIHAVLHTIERMLRSAEPLLDVGKEVDLSARFMKAGLLARSGLAAAVLLRAEEHRLTAALVRGAGEAEGPGALRLDPIGGEFAAESFAVRAAEAARIERTGDPLLPLHDLDPEDRHILFWQVAACLADEARPAASSEDSLHRAAAAAVARGLAGIDDAEGIAPASLRLAHRLQEAGQLDDTLIAGTLAGGRIASLAGMLAVRAGIGFDDARAMLTDPASCAVLLRACEVDRGVAAAMILALALGLDRGFGLDPAEMSAELIDAYQKLPVEQARAEVRHTRLEPAYRDALTALGTW